MPSAFFPGDRFPDEPEPAHHQRVMQLLHPVLADVLNQLEGTALGQALKDRAVEVSASKILRAPVDRAAALTGGCWNARMGSACR